ncbi:MAG: DUF1349 domain-containing protein [Planctomycetota bacterium]|jgi:hypothetical protein
MLEKKFLISLLCLVVVLGFSATEAMGGNILFIAAMDEPFIAGDDALKVFLEGLGHTVTYFDDGEDEATTEAAAAAADVVFISESVSSGQIRTEITEVEAPMVITEAWGYDEMGLTLGTGEGLEVATTDIEIVAPEHPLAAGLNGTVSVLTDITGVRGAARFTTGRAGNEATVIARATLSDSVTYDVIFVYEKGATLPVPPTDGSPRVAADIRVCLGFDEQSYLLWNENAYALLEAAINFALGIRLQPETYSPTPANGQKEVPRDVVLSWSPGIYADKHNVYFGTVFDDVNQASPADPRGVLVSEKQNALTYALGGALEFGQTYYWRVDEVNAPPDSAVYKGDVWSFTTVNFLVVDDFESYNDLDPTDSNSNRIFGTWIDGYGTTTNGSIVGYENPPFAEQSIVHGGEQSMPFFYDNNMKYSEAERALSGSASNWTREGVDSLVLWFRGYPAYVGSFVEAPTGTYTMTASGADIWDNADQFHFAFKEITGAGAIIAKVESLENTDPFAKAGVMIRDTLGPDSRNVALLITPENGVRFQYRSRTDGSTDRAFVEGITAPQWVRLERTTGGLVRAFYSADGTAWTLLSMTVMSMDMPVHIGLAVTSHNVDATSEAKFSNVSFGNTSVDPQWTDQDIGMMSNDAEPMYVTVGDGSGTAATVYHDDPNAVQIDTWMEWNIPLQGFANQGMDLTNVNTIGIGLGNRNNPQAGGSGTMYFDDIRLYRPR